MIATVACGLYMSWNGPLLISAATRLQGIFFWDLVIFLVEGMLFLLTGSQMRLLYEKYKALNASSDFASLTGERKKILGNALRDFRLSGAELPEDQKPHLDRKSVV